MSVHTLQLAAEHACTDAWKAFNKTAIIETACIWKFENFIGKGYRSSQGGNLSTPEQEKYLDKEWKENIQIYKGFLVLLLL